MPEFRDRYDAAAVSGQISQPPFAELAHRGRRRAHRTRTVRVAGVAVVAVLAAAPLLTLPSQTGPSTPAASSPPRNEDVHRHLEFLDLEYGLVNYFDPETCREWVVVTDDGGATWTEPREVPMFPGEETVEAQLHCLIMNVVPIATNTIVRHFDYELAYWAAGVDVPTTGYISYDNGQTWQEYEPQVRTADSVPDGVFPDPYCEEEYPTDQDYPEIGPGQDYGDVAPEGCGALQVGWLDPQTGDQMVLRTNPPGVESPVVVGYDGSIWAGGYDGQVGGAPVGDYHLSVSRDRGRTWQDATPVQGEDVDEPLTADRRFGFAAADGDTAYLFSTSWTGEGANHLYRTTDGGETWQPLPAGEQFEHLNFGWITRDGALVLEDVLDDGPPAMTTGLYLSRDEGNTFEQVEFPATPEQQVSGGFYGYGFDPETETATRALSADGLTWQALDVPAFRLPD
jgi:BNR/Asp-box repeat